MKRRRFLATGVRGGLGVTVASMLPPLVRAALAAAPPGSRTATTTPATFIERNDWPEHWETTLSALDRQFFTPNEAFFVRSHFPVPEIDLRDFSLTVRGLAVRPLALSLEELKAMPQTELVCTIECAGNGRGRFELPNTSGTQWEFGAIGTARWRGVPLAVLLERAEVPETATDVWFECADGVPFGTTTPRFVRSIPTPKARADVLVALEMNGAPVPPRHGGPVRVVVPDWYGMASAKWVTMIRAENRPSDGHFMVRGYRYQYPDADPKLPPPPVETMRVKSLITSPLEGARVAPGTVRVAGWAWSGEGRIARVEVSTDSMRTWREARLVGEDHEHAWRRWESTVPLAAGRSVTVAARATDTSGATQPVEARANAAGYANNSIHRVGFHARG